MGTEGKRLLPGKLCPHPSLKWSAQGLRVKDRGTPFTEGLILTQVLGDRLHPGHCLGILAASHGTGRAPGILRLQETEQKRQITRDVIHEAARRLGLPGEEREERQGKG